VSAAAYLPWFCSALALGGAAWSRSASDPAVQARRAARAAAAVAAVAVGLLGWVGVSGGVRSGAAVLDPLAAVTVAVASVCCLAIAVAAPRSGLESGDAPSLLAQLGAFSLAASASDGRVLAGAMLVGALFLSRLDGAPARGEADARRSALSLVPFAGACLAAIGTLWRAEAGDAAPASSAVLLWIGIWIRMGMAPFHGWVPVAYEGGRVGAAVMATVANPAPILLVRIGLAADPWDGRGAAVLAIAGIATAFYASFLCLAQRDLLRAAGFQALLHAGFATMGLASADPEGRTGGFLHLVSSSFCVTGLALVGWAVRARLGSAEIPRLGGIARRGRLLAAAFLVFGLASAGFPGSLGFASEDLIVHGIVEHHPYAAVALMIATAFGAIAVIRLYLLAFLGSGTRGAPAGDPSFPDLVPRERLSFAFLAVLLFGLGVVPGLLVGPCALAATPAAEEGGTAIVLAP